MSESLQETLSRLAHQYNRCKNRKERKEQRAIFRDILSTICEGEVVPKTIQIEGTTTTFTTWAHRLQLQALRGQLSGGFQTHLKGNTVIRIRAGGARSHGGRPRLSAVSASTCRRTL